MPKAREVSIASFPHRDLGARVAAHWLLILTVALLPFSYVPHELLASGPSFGPVILALILVTGVVHKAFIARPTVIEILTLVLAVWIAIRLLLISLYQSDLSEWPISYAATQVAPLLGGVIVFRIASVSEFKAPIRTGLMVALTLMLGIEGYQLAAGLQKLVGSGYVSPAFHYFTAAGEYRPFGTFFGPTTFGGYLAMVGAALFCVSRGRLAAIVFVAVVLGLLATDTRAAWLAFAIALLVVSIRSSSGRRARVVLLAAACGVILFLGPYMFPWAVNAPWQRLSTLFDPEFSSNAARISLWIGTLNAVLAQPFTGYGASPFVVVMAPYIGPVAELGHPHNNYLFIAYAYGISGAGLFISLLFAMLMRSRGAGDTWSNASLAALVAFAVDSLFETTWGSFNFIVTVFLLAGLGAAAASLDHRGVPLSDLRGPQRPQRFVEKRRSQLNP